MANAPVLKQFSSNLTLSESNVLEVRDSVSDAIVKAKKVEVALKTFEEIADKADSVADTLSSLKTGVQLLEKVGPLKVVGKALKTALAKMESAAKAVRDKAEDIDDRLEPAKIKVEEAREKLEDFETDLEDAAFEVAGYQASVSGAVAGLDALGNSGFEQGIATGVDAVATPPNAAVGKVNEAFAFTKAQIKALDDAIDVGTLNLAIDMKADLIRITGDIDFLKAPLKTLDSVLKPVKWALDAVDFVFNKVVAPVLNPILDALGVNKLFDKIADAMTALLPDVGDLNIAEDAIDDALAKLTPDIGLDAALGVPDLLRNPAVGEFGVLDFIDLSLGDARLIQGTDVSESLTGDGADNVISGGGGADILTGNGGQDIFIGGRGNDEIIGTVAGAGVDERAVFSGSLVEYLVEFSEDKRTVTITHDDPASSSKSDGTDTVQDVELFVFKDATLSRAALELGVQTTAGVGTPGSNKALSGSDVAGADLRDFLFGIGETGNVTLSGGEGDDHLVGGASNDFIFGDAGDDVLDGGTGGGDTLNGGAGFDTATFQSLLDNGSNDPSQRIDLGLVAGDHGSFGLALTASLTDVENVVGSNRGDILLGAENGSEQERLAGEGGDDFLRGYGGVNRLEGGDGADLIVADTVTDIVVGDGGADTFLLGGESGRTVDGGANFDVVSYAGGINAITSTFDNDVDGWTVIDGANGSFQASNGNPGGFFQGTDAPSGTWKFSAPGKFLGDQSDMFGGSLVFDLKQITGTATGGNATGEVELSDGTLTVSTSIAFPTSEFTTYEIALDDSQAWLETSGSVGVNERLDLILSNLQSITIRGEYANGADAAGIDNVVFSAQPLAPSIYSSFAVDNEGWNKVSIDNQTSLNIESEGALTLAFGGVPGQHVLGSDFGSGAWYFNAPTAYLGNQSDKYGGTFNYELRQDTGTGATASAAELIFKGAGISIAQQAANPFDAFTGYQFSVEEGAGWTIVGSGLDASASAIRTVLADLQAVYILGEYVNGFDIAALDSVEFRPDNPRQDAGFINEVQAVIAASPLGATAASLTVNAAAGTVEHRVGGALVGTDTTTDIEGYIGSAQADTFLTSLNDAGDAGVFHGGAGDDVFQEGVGRQMITGEAGDDTLVVNSRNFAFGETFNGGIGEDTLDLRSAAETRWQVNSGRKGFLEGVAATDDLPSRGQGAFSATISAYERFLTGDFDDAINAGDNGIFVDAGLGDDEIFTGAIDGGQFFGRGGNDQFFNLAGFNILMDGGDGADNFQTVGGFTDGEGATHTPTVLAGAGDDVIGAGSGLLIIDGGEGTDLLQYGGSVFGGGTSGVIIDLESGATAGGAGGQQITNIENVIGTGFNDQIDGDDESNLLVGGGGVDVLNGRGDGTTPGQTDEELAKANDALYGNDGGDFINGGEGDDLLHGGRGADSLNGGDGNDTASYVFLQEAPTEAEQIEGALIGSVIADLSAGSPTAVFTPTIVFEDFEGGASGWTGSETPSNGTLGAGAVFTEFLAIETSFDTSGPFGQDRTFDLGSSHTGEVVIDFDFYEIDQWSNDRLILTIDGAQFDLIFDNDNTSVPEAARSGTFTGGSFTVTPVSTSHVDLGFDATEDNIHHFTINVTNPGTSLGFEMQIASLSGQPAKAGIDNFTITTAAESDNLLLIENLVGGGLNDVLTGDAFDNFISGGGGDDVIEGGLGDDLLLDDFGADVISGGAGDDTISVGGAAVNGSGLVDSYDGGADTDTLDYTGITGAVTIDPTISLFRKTYDVEKPVWADTETTEARTFSGDSFTPEEIQQALEEDKADSADDFFRSLSNIPGDPAAQITTLIVAVTTDDTVTNFEKFFGSQFNDTFVATAGEDDFNGGDPAVDEDDPQHPDDDTISFARSTAGVNVDLGAGTFSGGFATAGSSYVGFSNVTGSIHSDNITGDDGDNVIDVGGGIDVVSAGAGNDIVSGDDANDVVGNNKTVNLGAGDDSLFVGFGLSGVDHVSAFGEDGGDDILAFAHTGDISGGDGDDNIQLVELSVFATRSTLLGDAGDDRLFFEGSGPATVNGGSGNDTAVVISAAASLLSNSASATDLISIENLEGSGQANTLIGDDGANILNGVSGSNTLTGNGGDDTLMSDQSSGASDGDDVFDGGTGNDTVSIGGDIGLNVNLATAGVQNTGRGSDTFISIENFVAGTGTDTLFGNADANILDGGADGGDDLNGLDGDDILISLGGNSFLDGGAGDDILRGHGFSLDGGAGIDTLESNALGDLTIDLRITGAGQATGATAGANSTLFINIENITLGGGAHTLTGDAADNILRTGSGNDVVSGYFGDDTLFTGGGADRLIYTEDAADRTDLEIWDGGDGIDIADYSGFHSAVQIDLTANHEAYSRDGTTVTTGAWRIIGELDGIEGVIGTDFNDRIFGDAEANELRGGAGADVVTGGIGDDQLFGDAGDDILTGRQNTDLLDGGEGDDRLFIDGFDTSVVGGAGFDRVSVQASLAVDINMRDSTVERADGNAGNDVFDASGVNDSFVIIRGFAGEDQITGGFFSDVLQGGDGDDVIVGGADRDRIFGEGGADSLSGGDGDDLLFADASDTFISGGAGLDILRVQSGNGITFNAAVGSVERVFGSNASSVGDVLSAAGGETTFVFEGRVGNDTLTGGNASDILRGGSGNDVMNGGAGGNDRLDGGGGPGDIFEFNTAWGRDVIEGGFADNGTELIRFAGVSDGTGGALDFSDLIIADSGGDAVITITGVATHSVTITNFDHTRLDAGDFSFV